MGGSIAIGGSRRGSKEEMGGSSRGSIFKVFVFPFILFIYSFWQTTQTTWMLQQRRSE